MLKKVHFTRRIGGGNTSLIGSDTDDGYFDLFGLIDYIDKTI